MEINNKRNWKRKVAGFILLAPLMILLLAGIVMLLWNAILPDIMPVSKISFWQALGILVLSKILFGGLRMGSRFKHRQPDFKNNFKEKLMNMSEEERQQFKEQWKSRCKRD